MIFTQYFLTSQSSFVYTHLNDFKYCYQTLIILFTLNNNPSKILNSSICPIDETLTGSTTSGQSGPGSNGNE